MEVIPHFSSLSDLQDRLESLTFPDGEGSLEMIVRRPETGTREVLNEAVIDSGSGMLGDNWSTRGSRHTKDGSAHPEMQIAIMNSKVIDLITNDRRYWPLAGNQLYVDFDLSQENLPVGQQLAIGELVVEITAMPHTGCGKFTKRFGRDATRFVNRAEGMKMRLRGVHTKVITGAKIKVGDKIRKL